MKYNLFLLILLTTLFTAALYSQENTDEVTFIEELYTQAELQRIEMEIKTSTLRELAAWSRSLGLSESGNRDALASRLRAHFNLSEEEAQDSNQRIITIESAHTSEYFTIDVIDEDYARLTGNVSIVLREDDAIHRIRADEILLNRTRNMMTARGNVVYTMEIDDTTQIFRGHNITVDIDSWSTILLDGNSQQNADSGGTVFRFEGTVISRDDNDVTILNRGIISNAVNEEALWSINASRIWLLPGADFAIFNAVLKVGEIPMMYIPFFFFPADEIVFRPVIGYRTREGAFIQTTAYILGRPKASEEDTMTTGLISGGSADMERERHGIFLRSTGRKIQDENETSLKAMFDYYVNLGYILGLDLSVPRSSSFDQFDLTLGIGFTRTVTNTQFGWTPFAPDYDGSFDWNHSNIFSSSVPFRYRFRTSSRISGRYGSVRWDIPLYSDPFVDNDFTNRSENMDWVNIMQQGLDQEIESSADGEIGPYQWEITGSLNPSFPNLSPYITRINISNIASTLTFRRLADNTIQNTADPGRFFFAPDKYTIYNTSVSINGTLFSSNNSRQTASEAETEFDDPLAGIGTPRSPWSLDNEDESFNPAIDDKLIPPALNQVFQLPGTGNLEFRIGYTLSPSSHTELQFMSGHGRWQTSDDVNWNDVQTILTNISGSGNVNFNLNHTSGLFSNTFTVTGRGTWADFIFLNEEAEAFRTPQTQAGTVDESRIAAARRNNYQRTNYETTYDYTGTLRPLYDNPIFGRSNLSYRLTGFLVRSKRFAGERNSPQLTPDWGAWVKNSSDEAGITNNNFSANLNANIMDKLQTFTFGAALPPLDGLITTSARFNVWISETSVSFGFRNPEMINNEPNNRWIRDQIRITESLRFSNNHLFTYNMVIDPELDNEIISIDSTLTLWNLGITFRANRLRRMDFAAENLDSTNPVWVERDEEPRLIPINLNINYRRSFQNVEIIKNRLLFSINLNSGINFNLREYTNSNLHFGMGFNLKIPGFMDIGLTVNSNNNVIFRYFKGIPGMEDMTLMYPDGPQNNIFIDLFDSFNFFDNTKRQRSGFKMNNLTLDITHYLGDWKAELEINIRPERNLTASIPRYDVIPNVTFLVSWSPIPQLKADIEYSRETERWSIR